MLLLFDPLGVDGLVLQGFGAGFQCLLVAACVC